MHHNFCGCACTQYLSRCARAPKVYVGAHVTHLPKRMHAWPASLHARYLCSCDGRASSRRARCMAARQACSLLVWRVCCMPTTRTWLVVHGLRQSPDRKSEREEKGKPGGDGWSLSRGRNTIHPTRFVRLHNQPYNLYSYSMPKFKTPCRHNMPYFTIYIYHYRDSCFIM